MTTQDTASSTDPVEAPPVPETLLVPLLDTAAAALARLDPGEVPPVLRPLAGFDRRRLTTSGPARQQLRRAFDVDDDFRAKVVEQLREKPEIEAALDSWSAASALAQVRDAAERSDLPLLASALYAARPRGWAFGIGMICAVADQERADKEHTDDVKAAELRAASFDEARRRAETARDVARADAARLEEELREERAGRRDRDSRARGDVEEADRRRRDAEQAAEQARAEAGDARARHTREAERAREAEKELRALRRELDQHVAEAAAPSAAWARPDVDALARATEESRRLTASLEGLTQRAREAALEESTVHDAGVQDAAVQEVEVQEAAADAAVEPSPRRTRVPCPPGMRADTPDALDAMVRTRGVVLVVDGYNVSMRGWPDVKPADQRERLLAALERLHLRVRCDVVVVFDGADVGHIPGPRRTGVRVVFSAEGEEADPVVVREVSARPPRVPAIVVSSDGWVRDHAEAEGATVVPSPVLLDVLRR